MLLNQCNFRVLRLNFLLLYHHTSICSVIFYESFCVSTCLLIYPFLLECLFVSVYSVYPRFCDPDAFSMILFRSAVRIVCVHRDALTQRINSTVRRVLRSSNVSSRYLSESGTVLIFECYCNLLTVF